MVRADWKGEIAVGATSACKDGKRLVVQLSLERLIFDDSDLISASNDRKVLEDDGKFGAFRSAIAF